MDKFKCSVCDDIFESNEDITCCPSCGSEKIKKLRFTVKKSKGGFEF